MVLELVIFKQKVLSQIFKLIVTSFYPWKINHAINHEIEHVEKSFQVVTYNTICTGHIQHNNHDVTIVEVTMTREKIQKLLNPEINQNGGV